MNATQETAIAHYLGKGLSKDVAVGIIAVLEVESGLKSGSQGAQSTETPGELNPAGAFGAASWNGLRQKALFDFATQKGLNPGDLLTQLDFILTESANSYPSVWKAMTGTPGISYTDFIGIFVDDYEIPANKPREITAAMSFAKEWIDASIAPITPPTPPAPVPDPGPRPPVPPEPHKTPSHARLAFLLALSDLMDAHGIIFLDMGNSI